MLLTILAEDTWKPTAGEATGGVVGVGYECPRCHGVNEIRVQPPEAPEEGAVTTVTTELWCHRCQIGTPATINRN